MSDVIQMSSFRARSTPVAPVRLYSIPEVAELLSVSRQSIYRLINAKEIKTVEMQIVGKKFSRVRADDLQDFIEAHTVGGAS